MWLYLTALVIVSGYLYLQNKWQYWKRRGIPGPTPTISGMGHSVELFKFNNETGVDKWKKECGEIYGLFFLWTQPALYVEDTEIIKEICVKQFNRFSTRGRSRTNTAFGKMSKDFMTVIEGHAWKRQRTTITPFFSGARLMEMTPILNNAIKKVMKDFIDPAIVAGESLDTKNFAQEYAMTAIMGSGFSIDPMENPQFMKSAMQHGRAFIDISLWKSFGMTVIPEFIRFYFNMIPFPKTTDKWLRELTSSLVAGAKEARSTGKKVRPDFVSLMTEHIISDKQSQSATKGFTHEELVAQSVLFILAGFNTTSDVLKFVLYALTMNPDVQEELYQSIQEEVKGDLTYDAAKKLKFVDAVIKETQRFYTIAPFLIRECDEDTVVKGIQIEKGIQVFFNLEAIHMNEQFYKEPKVFNPHRFDGHESNTLQDEHWYGFGNGPRACPAVRWAFLAMKIMIVNIVRNYKIVKTDKTLEPHEWKMGIQGIVLGPDKPLLVGFERRS